MAGRRAVALLALSTLAIASMSGCLWALLPESDDDQGPLTEEEAQVVTEEAYRSFTSALQGDAPDDLRYFEMSVDSAPSSEASMPGSVSIRVTFGANDITETAIKVADGGMEMAFTGWCTPQGPVMQWGAAVFAGRPYEDSSDGCDGVLSWGEGGAMGPEMDDPVQEILALDNASVKPQQDGSIIAHVTEDDGTEVTAWIDSKGRLARVHAQGSEETTTATFSYGQRDHLAVPEPTARLPAKIDVSTDIDRATGRYAHTVTSAPEEPTLDEIEARWLPWDDSGLKPAFPLTGGTHVDAGFEFAYDDVDGDGRVSEGDTFLLIAPIDPEDDQDRSPAYLSGGRVLLYDLWADAPVNEHPIPAPGVVGLLLAVGLACLFVRRRGP